MKLFARIFVIVCILGLLHVTFVSGDTSSWNLIMRDIGALLGGLFKAFINLLKVIITGVLT